MRQDAAEVGDNETSRRQALCSWEAYQWWCAGLERWE